jgi:hypothetical protein
MMHAERVPFVRFQRIPINPTELTASFAQRRYGHFDELTLRPCGLSQRTRFRMDDHTGAIRAGTSNALSYLRWLPGRPVNQSSIVSPQFADQHLPYFGAAGDAYSVVDEHQQ